MKTVVVTDSTAYIPEETRNRLNIHTIPLSVVFGDESYKEEIDLSTEAFYTRLRESKELPKTTQPSTGMFVELFEKLSEQYDAVISIHLSSGISGTYQGAVTAGQMVDAINVYPYDSEISCMVQGFYVEEAAKMALEGKEPEEIISRLDELKTSSRAYFMVDDLTNLQKGGRLSAAQALIGSLLQVKPLLHFVDKVIVPFEKIRTKKKAKERIFNLLGEDAKTGDSYRACIIHGNRKEEALRWKQELEEKYPNVEFTISYFGPVIGTHLGEGAMGLGWLRK
ncbi:DegV family protein [Fervidibacillus albus]|uniref:DegV family protein n=1 Tax=Fervidibacillus albus TaxID=2980026 RepID=A0A9E8RVR8_9BACI|nr:DegV family protein [Fervidibacillus albus]WAA09781.1 DegV family protein [Fervidibacillus albus]